MQKVIVATGIPEYDSSIRKIEGYEYIPIKIGYKSELKEACITFKPDMIIISEKLSGPEMLSEVAINIKQTVPSTRIIYLAGEVDLNNINRINKLGVMVLSGIYDIITDRKVNKGMIENVLKTPRSKSDVEYLLRYFVDKRKDQQEVSMEYIEEIEEEEYDDSYKNVFMVSSIKPGTGKSFVSVNIATALAKFGEQIDGRPPRIAIIEADLQTLSLGTILAIEDDRHNLKTVMDKIATVISDDGNLVKDKLRINEVNEYILNSFKQYDKCKNLYALVGSQLSLDDIENISPLYYSYLIDLASQKFDYVIIDSNSSLVHVTTYPLLSLVNRCYYILNLDFNNVRNNMRYRHTLKEIGVYDKIRFVLNEDLTEAQDNVEKLQFDANVLAESFDLVAKIPAIPKSIFLNRLWQGVPVVLDDVEHTIKARYELSKIANEIHPITNLNFLERESERISQQSTKKKKKFFWF